MEDIKALIGYCLATYIVISLIYTSVKILNYLLILGGF